MMACGQDGDAPGPVLDEQDGDARGWCQLGRTEVPRAGGTRGIWRCPGTAAGHDGDAVDGVGHDGDAQKWWLDTMEMLGMVLDEQEGDTMGWCHKGSTEMPSDGGWT